MNFQKVIRFPGRFFKLPFDETRGSAPETHPFDES